MKKLKFSKKVVAASIVAAIGVVIVGITVQNSLAEERANPKGSKNEQRKPDPENNLPILRHGEGCSSILNEHLSRCAVLPGSPADKAVCRKRAFDTYNACMGR